MSVVIIIGLLVVKTEPKDSGVRGPVGFFTSTFNVCVTQCDVLSLGSNPFD